MRTHSKAIYSAVAGSLFALIGCVSNPNDNNNQSAVFDFSTTKSCSINLNYDVPEGYNVYFEIYTSNPLELDSAGQIVKRDINPIDAGMTDGKGKYSQKITMPACAKELYAYSPYAGVPRILKSEMIGDVMTEFKYFNEDDAVKSFSSTRATDDYKNAEYNKLNTLKRLGYWINSKKQYQLNGVLYDLYGRPDYLNSEKLTLSRDIYNIINQTIPEGQGSKINLNLIKNGDVHITKQAHVDLFLLDETTSANSTLAYYCYPTATPPQTTAQIKDIVIALPNSKVLKYHYYNPSGYTGALERGEGIRLHYWKDGVNMGDEFPENTSIGWIIYNQSYSNASKTGTKINEIDYRFFASKILNKSQRGHVVLFKSGDMVIFGFEDWPGDYDYNDVVFYIKSDPIEAITENIPEINLPTIGDSDIVTNVTYYGILAFEDIWPSQGDFDMNDVVVSYESVVGYNIKNEVIQTTDNFTIMWSGATINNSFAYQLDARRSEVEIDITSSLGGNGGAYVDQTLDKATIRLANNLLEYANKPTKAEFTVTTKYTGRRISKEDFTRPPYNPFITTTSANREVHLTNFRPTEMLDKSLFGKSDDKSNPATNLYYITRDKNGQQMPFAINLTFESKSAQNAYVIPKERARIDEHYPGFKNWVKSGGKTNNDWYLHPVQ